MAEAIPELAVIQQRFDTVTTERDQAVLTVQNQGIVIASLNTQIEARDLEIDNLQAYIDELEKMLSAGPIIGVSTGTPLPPGVTNFPGARIYFKPGYVPRSWTAYEPIRAAVAAGVTDFLISVRTDDVAALRAFFETMPKDAGYKVWLAYWHEIEGAIRKGNMTLEKYRQDVPKISALAAEFGFEFGVIHNGSNPRPGQSSGWGWYKERWAEVDAGLTGYYTFLGVDGYAHEEYTDPVDLFRPFVEYADEVGLPMAIGELGSPPGAGQVAWAGKARDMCYDLANNIAIALWWNSVDQWDYRLSPEAAQAWFD